MKTTKGSNSKGETILLTDLELQLVLSINEEGGVLSEEMVLTKTGFTKKVLKTLVGQVVKKGALFITEEKTVVFFTSNFTIEEEVKEEPITEKKKSITKTEVELSAIEKVRKLMEFSIENGATESEVETALKLAKRLMVKHNLEQQDVEISLHDVNITRIQSTWNGKVSALEVRSFEAQLLMVLGKVYSCTIVVDRNKSTNTDFYDIIGLPEDREILVLTYESILPQIRVLYKKRYRETDKSLSEFRFVTSYTAGFLSGLREKLFTQKDSSLKASELKTFELIVVKKDTLVHEWIKENMNLKKSKPKSTSLDKDTFDKGVKDGSEKGLDKQLGEKN